MDVILQVPTQGSLILILYKYVCALAVLLIGSPLKLFERRTRVEKLRLIIQVRGSNHKALVNSCINRDRHPVNLSLSDISVDLVGVKDYLSLFFPAHNFILMLSQLIKDLNLLLREVNEREVFYGCCRCMMDTSS